MADIEKLNALLAEIDELTGDVHPSPTPVRVPMSFADQLAAATGLPTVVVEGAAEDTPYQGAFLAAQAAIQRLVIPPEISDHTSRAIDDLDHGTGRA